MEANLCAHSVCVELWVCSVTARRTHLYKSLGSPHDPEGTRTSPAAAPRTHQLRSAFQEEWPPPIRRRMCLSAAQIQRAQSWILSGCPETRGTACNIASQWRWRCKGLSRQTLAGRCLTTPLQHLSPGCYGDTSQFPLPLLHLLESLLVRWHWELTCGLGRFPL